MSEETLGEIAKRMVMDNGMAFLGHHRTSSRKGTTTAGYQ